MNEMMMDDEFAQVITNKKKNSKGSAANNKLEKEILTKILLKESSKPCYYLNDITTFPSWDYSWPTLTKNKEQNQGQNKFTSDETFFFALKQHNHGFTYKLLKQIGAVEYQDDGDIVLFGESLMDIVLKNDDMIKKKVWNLQLIGEKYLENESGCVQRAKKFIHDVFSWIRKENEYIMQKNEMLGTSAQHHHEDLFDLTAVKTSRSKSTITVVVPEKGGPDRTNIDLVVAPMILQLSFSPFVSIQDLFASTYPSCTRIAISNNNAVVLDAMTRYCLENSCTILNEDCLLHCCNSEDGNNTDAPMISTEMQRYIDYFHNKGLDIILPGLDITKIPKRNLNFNIQEVLDLPFLTAIYSKLEGNKIMVDKLRSPNYKANMKTECDVSGISLDNVRKSSIHHNIQCLVADTNSRFVYAVEGENIDPIFDFVPMITNRMLDECYGIVKESLLLPSGGNVDVNIILKYFASPEDVIESLIIDPIRKQQQKTKNVICLLPSQNYYEMDEGMLDQLIGQEKESIIDKLKTLRDTMKNDGLDKLVFDFTQETFTGEELYKALYGTYGLDSSSDGWVVPSEYPTDLEDQSHREVV